MQVWLEANNKGAQSREPWVKYFIILHKFLGWSKNYTMFMSEIWTEREYNEIVVHNVSAT